MKITNKDLLLHEDAAKHAALVAALQRIADLDDCVQYDDTKASQALQFHFARKIARLALTAEKGEA